MSLSYYELANEWINSSSKICPYCKCDYLRYSSTYSSSCKCLNSCLVIYYSNFNFNYMSIREWSEIIIFLNSSASKALILNKGDFDLGIKYCNSGQRIYFPHFNIFDYSIQDLKKKIESYLVFA